MFGTISCNFLIRSLIRVLLTLSARLLGCVAKPLFALILLGTESGNWTKFSTLNISDDFLGKLK